MHPAHFFRWNIILPASDLSLLNRDPHSTTALHGIPMRNVLLIDDSAARATTRQLDLDQLPINVINTFLAKPTGSLLVFLKIYGI